MPEHPNVDELSERSGEQGQRSLQWLQRGPMTITCVCRSKCETGENQTGQSFQEGKFGLTERRFSDRRG